jgi:hypothetical protein
MIFRISILIAALGVLLSTQSACTSQKVPTPARAAATPGAAASSPALPGVVRRSFRQPHEGRRGMSASLWLQFTYISFAAWNVAVIALSIGAALCAVHWACSKFIDTYTLVMSVREAYRQGRDPWWPFWRRKAKEMRGGR